MKKDEDTADKIGTIGECLYSIGNRVEVAKILYARGEKELLDTILEDIARSVQDMFDAYSVVKEE